MACHCELVELVRSLIRDLVQIVLSFNFVKEIIFMKKAVFILFSIVLLSGCNNDVEVLITMNCSGTETEIMVSENSKLSCNLLDEEYEFTIEEIKDGNITISTNKNGLSVGAGILNSERRWVIKKGKKLIIHTNTTDWQEEVEFSW